MADRTSPRPGATPRLKPPPEPGSGRLSPLHQTLRSATASAHRALDHHPLLRRLTGGGLTREQYAESLVAMYRPHVRLERLVHKSDHHVQSGLGLSPRFSLLEADLLELGCAVPPVWHIPPDPFEGRAAWWGRVYVLEGSRLGGAVIAKCIRSRLGDTVPCRFLGAPLMPNDHSAMQVLRERDLEAPDQLEQAVASARAAFVAYQAGLDTFKRGRAATNCGQGS